MGLLSPHRAQLNSAPKKYNFCILTLTLYKIGGGDTRNICENVLNFFFTILKFIYYVNTLFLCIWNIPNSNWFGGAPNKSLILFVLKQSFWNIPNTKCSVDSS